MNIFSSPEWHTAAQQHQKDGGGKFVFDNFRADSLSGYIEQQVVRCRSLVVPLLFLPFGSERAADYWSRATYDDGNGCCFMIIIPFSMRWTSEVIKSFNSRRLLLAWHLLLSVSLSFIARFSFKFWLIIFGLLQVD